MIAASENAVPRVVRPSVGMLRNFACMSPWHLIGNLEGNANCVNPSTPLIMTTAKSCIQVDVYSLGCILNECWTRQQPWRDSSHFFQVLLCQYVPWEANS
jgi:hypothetical protein